MTIASPIGFQVIAVPPDSPRKQGLMRRIYDSVFVTRERDAQRTVETYLARRGNRLTDSVERELAERMLDGQWPRRAL